MQPTLKTDLRMWHQFFCWGLQKWEKMRLMLDNNLVLTPCIISHFPLISRPGRSQGLLYKHLCNWLIHSLSDPLVKISLWSCHAQAVKNGASTHKTNYIDILKEILNPEGHQNHCIGSKVTAILLNGGILPTGGASSGRVCSCSLRSKIVSKKYANFL